VLPTTLAAESDGGSHTEITFRRIVVFPGGREETDETPKQIAPPASHMLPRSDEIEVDAKDIKELDS
jgi:hypothetical protein